MSYKSINTTKLIDKYKNSGYKNRLDLLKKLSGTISDNTDDMRTLNSSKAKWITVCSWMIFSLIIIIIILIIRKGVLNVW